MHIEKKSTRKREKEEAESTAIRLYLALFLW